MAVIHLTEENFEQEVLQASETVLVDFFADWCGPCKMLAPLIEKIAEEHTEVKVCKLDTDAAASIAIRYRVMSIPTLIVFKNGEVVNQAIGVQSESDIIAMLQ